MSVKLPKLPNLSRREKGLAIGSLLFICIWTMDRFVISPWWDHTVKVYEETGKLEGVLNRQRGLINRKPQIMAQVNAYRDHLNNAEMGQVDMAALLREVEALGIESGIELGEVKPLATDTHERYEIFGFEVRFSGTLSQWVHFVHLVQASSMLFEVERASMETTDADSPVLKGFIRTSKKTLQRYSGGQIESDQTPAEAAESAGGEEG